MLGLVSLNALEVLRGVKMNFRGALRWLLWTISDKSEVYAGSFCKGSAFF